MWKATRFIARYEAELKYRYRVHLEVDTRSNFVVRDLVRFIVLARDLFTHLFVFLFYFFCGAFTKLYVIVKKFGVLEIKGIHAK